MKTATHTPGPWRTCQQFPARVEPGVYGGHGEAIAECWWAAMGIKGRTEDEARANARLIAAAPDLAGALRQIATYDPGRIDAATLGNIARAALLKAGLEV